MSNSVDFYIPYFTSSKENIYEYQSITILWYKFDTDKEIIIGNIIVGSQSVFLVFAHKNKNSMDYPHASIAASGYSRHFCKTDLQKRTKSS
ncbi:hypothetical protein EZS27_010027 [termite gut metagenome]|uniref:Uncharacterized protein n=1 Tax=termite gut metagenome TaxID=433724 RepID=A0A5J4S7W8_9ZZZZ